MVLEIIAKDIKGSLVPWLLLKGVWYKILPEICRAQINDNEVSMDLEQGSSLCAEESSLKCLQPYGIPITISYSQTDPKKSSLQVTLPSDKRYSFIFETHFGLHHIINRIFATGRLEKQGLSAPEYLEAQMEYQTPSKADLEDIAMARPDGIKSTPIHERAVNLKISGKLPRDIFLGVEDIFDRAIDDIRVGARIKGGNVLIDKGMFSSGLDIILQGATLEDVERFAGLGFSRGYSLKMKDVEDEKTYDLLREKEN